jgi:hypothetical protein
MPETNEEVKELDLADIKNRLLKLKAQLEHDIDMKEQQVAESGDDLVPERGGVGSVGMRSQMVGSSCPSRQMPKPAMSRSEIRLSLASKLRRFSYQTSRSCPFVV